MDTNIIYNIDCVAGMNQMIDEASIDLIIADPPICKDPITLQTRHCFGLLLTTSNHLSY